MSDNSTGMNTPRTAKKAGMELRAPFAEAFSNLLALASIKPSDYAAFGRAIAAAQEPARPIAYGDYTIDAWAKGNLLPSNIALRALQRTLLDEYNVPATPLMQLETLHNTALVQQSHERYQPSELTNALATAASRAGLSFHALGKNAEAWNEKHSKSAKLAASNVAHHFLLSGDIKTPPSKLQTYNIHQATRALLSEADTLVPPLPAVHEMALREHADSVWQQASAETPANLGGMIQAMRTRLGESQKEFGVRLGQALGLGKPLSAASICKWENNQCIPVGSNDRTSGETACPALIELMKIADASPNALARAIEAPWFTPEKEVAFRDAFQAAIDRADSITNYHADIDASPIPTPEIRKVSPSLKIYTGSLRHDIMSGKKDRSL